MTRTLERDPGGAGNGWRFALLGGATSGLALAPAIGVAGNQAAHASSELALAGSVALLALWSIRARAPRSPPSRAWVACLALAACALGLALGLWRLAAIDAGAARGETGAEARLRGFVSAVPRREGGEVSVQVETASGRLLVRAREPVPELPVGREIAARGVLREAAEWEAGHLARQGIAQVLEARRLAPTGRRRGGAAALADAVRDRAQRALERGTPPDQSALLRGFVLGQDDRIDPLTIQDFRRSGLAHLLAVSGQNVLLLALLAAPILALLGLSLRARLACILGLIALYVPVAGAGPSIQRAGVMGAAAVIATLASRPSSRWYSLLLAAFVTLTLNPRTSGDAGWQLSFAAVAGIALLAAPLRDLLAWRQAAGTADSSAEAWSWRRALAEGLAVTLAATLATAPLMAHHFQAVAVLAIPANLVALPAVAPVMWLGMLAAAAGQLTWLPVEPLTGLAGLLAAYIAQVAHWFAAPGWAQIETTGVEGALGLSVAYAALAATTATAIPWLRRRAGTGLRRGALALGLASLAPAVVMLAAGRLGGAAAGEQRPPGLAVHVLDVGQGDAIALDPRRSPPLLVDGGPPGGGLAELLDELGIERLEAALVTHDQADHAGGIEELLGLMPVGSLLHARAGPQLSAAAEAAGVPVDQIAAGSRLRAGALRLQVLWPPRAMLESPAGRDGDPNALSLVILARWRGFELLLTGDAEAELAPVDPGLVEVLKVAHHGSEDAGLEGLLERSAPQLAVISVGDANPYGHPAPSTLAELDEHDVPVLRTDQQGTISLEVGRRSWGLVGEG